MGVMTEIKPGAAVGFIGLGKMGAPMATRLAEVGYQVQGYAHTAEPSAHPQIGEIIRVRALG
jgi:3-hydroxyisobutyrate dehydrogenase-like beta-hydroxyacid dehydrogenase